MLRPDRGSRALQEQRPARTAHRQASVPASPDFSASEGSVRARSPSDSSQNGNKNREFSSVLGNLPLVFSLCSGPPRHGLGPPVPTWPEPPFTLLTTASSPLSSKREAGGFPPGWKIQPRASYLLCRSGRSDILRMTSGSPVTASTRGMGPLCGTIRPASLLSGAAADRWN